MLTYKKLQVFKYSYKFDYLKKKYGKYNICNLSKYSNLVIFGSKWLIYFNITKMLNVNDTLFSY